MLVCTWLLVIVLISHSQEEILEVGHPQYRLNLDFCIQASACIVHKLEYLEYRFIPYSFLLFQLVCLCLFSHE